MRILAAGSNLMAQFGIGDEPDSSIFKEILSISQLEEGQSILLGAGANHTIIAIKSSNIVWVAGDNRQGQLGLGSDGGKISILTKTTLSFVIGSQLVCGWDYTFLLDENCQVWATGSNKYGLLGISKKILGSSRWILIEGPLSKCKKIACGWRHTLFLDNHGFVFGAGSLEKSRLDSLIEENEDKERAMKRLQFEKKIVDLACGMYHSIFLDETNRIFVIGRDKHCVLLQDSILPKILNNDDFPIAVHSAWSSLAFKTQQGRIYTWGRGDLGQLGCGTSMSTSVPANITCNSEYKVKDINMGSEYAVILLETGEVLVFGFNDHGNLGLGHLENVLEPTSIGSSIHCRAVAAGYGHLLLCCD